MARGPWGRGGPLALAFAAGGVMGALGHAWFSPSSARGPRWSVAPPAIVVAGSAAPVSATPPDPRRKPVDESVGPPPPDAPLPAGDSRAIESSVAGESSLKAERKLLDRARAAHGRGDDAQCLALVEAHARTFAHGRLVEEREALAVKALVAVGRAEEARQRAGRFRVRYPQSLLLSAIDDAIGTIP